MRKQIGGLVLLAKDAIREDPTSAALFGFINVRGNSALRARVRQR